MNFEMPNFAPAIPEIFVLSMACLILIVDLYLSEKNRVVTYLLSLGTLVVASLLTVSNHSPDTILTFSGTFISDTMGDVLKIFIYLVTGLVFIYSRTYLQDRNLFKGEYYVLGLFGVLGMMILVSAHNFLTIYLGLELLSLSLYALVAMHRDNHDASEAAMKYFVLGALASGMLLYGMSLLYGVTGSLDIEKYSQLLQQLPADERMALVLGMVMVIVGIAFKLGAVPFHMWVPDIYHGAPTAVTLYIGTAPKLAAFAMLMRLLVEGLGSIHSEWQGILIIMAILSMGVGNVIAIAQTNIKRMLAYSTISHVGFILLGILAGNKAGYSAAMFYTIVYAIMSLGGFGMIILLSRAGFEADKLDDFKGLNQKSPWFAFMMLILMFSMAGVPPTIGFFAKLSVLQAVVGVSSANLVWVAVVAVIFSIIGAFYYIRMVKIMYFDKPDNNDAIESNPEMKILISANSLAVLGLGLFPHSLYALCMASMPGL
ncbi:MAG: NADH-quinone oxidoreductase subunit NuoN [Gammaproteobacteria bacterium]|nr:NADH-quinone oxidoreductase subunit NuoN [Gammaproteobacteria bacterium]MDH5800484.1 NADH-quinone oxidoreductase subunit NuoN [Gammaproteobacteria bacterium]